MIKLESKKGIVNGKQEKVYNFLSDFRNFAQFLPQEHLNNLDISEYVLRFEIGGIGRIGLKIAERNPFSLIKITATEDSASDFNFRLMVSGIRGNQSQVQLALQAQLNMFIEMMAKDPLQRFIDMIVEKLTTVDFEKET
jgi:hypothetical protein